MERGPGLVAGAIAAAAALAVGWIAFGASDSGPPSQASSPIAANTHGAELAEAIIPASETAPARSAISASDRIDADATRALRVTVQVVPEHLREHYRLSAAAFPQRAARPITTAPATDDVADLRVPAGFSGAVAIHATHVPTGWETVVARAHVLETATAIALDLNALRAGDRVHNLMARVEAGPESGGPLALTLIPLGGAERAEASSAPFAPTGPTTVWVHGLRSALFVPILVNSPEGRPGDYRCEFAPIRIGGDTQVDLRVSDGGRMLVALADADAGQPVWLTLRRRDGTRVAHVQTRPSAGTISASGLPAGELLVQATALDKVSSRVLVRVDRVGAPTLQLALGRACELNVRLDSQLAATALEIREARSGAAWPLSDEELARFRQSRILQVRLPEGRYSVLVRTECGAASAVVVATPPAAHAVLR
jgi:hypothetical protein